MKKIRFALFLFLIVGILFPVIFTLVQMGYFNYQPKIEIENVVPDNSPVIKVIADKDFSPYSFYNSDNQKSGYDIELINEIANRLQMKVDITFADWETCKEKINNKEVDLVLGYEVSNEYDGVLKTLSTAEDRLVLLGKEKIQSATLIKKKKVGIVSEPLIEKLYDLNCEYVEFPSVRAVMDAIENDEIDYGICHRAVAKKTYEKSKHHLKIIDTLTIYHMCIGVNEDNSQLRDVINSILMQMEIDGVLNQLKEKWLLTYTYKQSLGEVFFVHTRFYTLYTIFFLFVLCIFVFIYDYISRREKIYSATIAYQDSLRRQNDILKSLASVFHTMHIINLKEDTVEEITTTDQVKQYVNKSTNAVEQMRLVMRYTVVQEDVEMALNFTDLATLTSRMGDMNTLMAEFRGTEIGWFCAQFIAIARDPYGKLLEVLFTTQCIDGMKKEKERLQRLSAFDELTMLYNRRSFSDRLLGLKKARNKNATIIIIDVNQLKYVNDTLGHPAGDELICGVAQILRTVFDNVGESFRIGGDEFSVLIESELSNLSDYLKNFNAKIEEWQGSKCQSMSVSYGVASASEIENFSPDNYEEIVTLADNRMYEDKAKFYRISGIERRK